MPRTLPLLLWLLAPLACAPAHRVNVTHVHHLVVVEAPASGKSTAHPHAARPSRAVPPPKHGRHAAALPVQRTALTVVVQDSEPRRADRRGPKTDRPRHVRKSRAHATERSRPKAKRGQRAKKQCRDDLRCRAWEEAREARRKRKHEAKKRDRAERRAASAERMARR